MQNLNVRQKLFAAVIATACDKNPSNCALMRATGMKKFENYVSPAEKMFPGIDMPSVMYGWDRATSGPLCIDDAEDYASPRDIALGEALAKEVLDL